MLLVSVQVHAQKVRAVVDANTLSQNDVFSFKVVADDAEELPKVDIAPILSDFTIVSGPAQQTNIQWINGRKTSSRSLSWMLVPKAPGEYIIPSLAVEISNKKFSTNLVRITVIQSDPVFVSDDLILKVDVDKKKVTVGEQITVEYTLYTKVNMSIQNLEFPEHTGFWAEELYVPKQIEFKDDQIDGVEYKSATLYRVALFPTQSGDYPLTPMAVHCQVAVQNKNSRRSFWDDPFFSNFTRQTVPKVLRTEETIISVNSFPEPQPGDFSGAVGTYTISSNLESVNVKANDAISLKIIVNGTGNIPLFSMPNIDFPQDLEVFPPSVSISKEPFRDAITGSITYEYVIIPRQTGRYTFDRIEFSYYDPESKNYNRISSRPIQLSVAPGDIQSIDADGYSKKEVVLLGQDIRFIRTELPDWNQPDKIPLEYQIIIGLYAFTLVVAIFPGIVRSINSSRESTYSRRQSRGAYRTAVRLLRKKSDDPFGQVSKSIYRYAHDKFMLSTSNFDPLSLKKILEPKVSDRSLINEIIQLLQICDAGQFAPGADQFKSTINSKARQILRRIDALL
jgi:hypothetical protein